MVRPVSVSDLVLDAGTQMRVSTDHAVIREYAEQMREGAVFPPVGVVETEGGRLVLWDGFTRVAATRMNGGEVIIADVECGTERDAFVRALGANFSNGQRRTNADKSAAVVAALRDAEIAALPNVRIAKMCGVSEFLVRDVRKQVSVPRLNRVRKATPQSPETADGGDEMEDEEDTGFEKSLNGVELGDAIEIMARMAASSVSLVVTSPEYPGQMNNSMSVPEWFRFMFDVFSSFRRIVKPDGVVVVNIAFKRDHNGWFDHRVFDIPRVVAAPNGFNVADTYIWDKMNPAPSGPMDRADIPGWEFVFVFAKAQNYRFVPQVKNYEEKSRVKLKPGNLARKDDRYAGGHERENGLGARQSNVLHLSPTGEPKRPRADGVSFPVALAERFVLQHTVAGDLVFDPFCGAGTTMIAAARNGRLWYGCDISTIEVKKARKWLREETGVM